MDTVLPDLESYRILPCTFAKADRCGTFDTTHRLNTRKIIIKHFRLDQELSIQFEQQYYMWLCQKKS